MTTIIDKIPEGLQTNFLRETESGELPAIRREGGVLRIPALVRRTEDGYVYFDVPVPFTGQDISDYAKCLRQSYAALRRFFYGDWAKQLEQQLHGTFARHQYAVKTAFPKVEGEVIPEVERFAAIKDEFWTAVDAACAEVGKTRADLPAKFNSEDMARFAVENGMAAAKIAEYAQVFSTISLNLLQNGRNWDELF